MQPLFHKFRLRKLRPSRTAIPFGKPRRFTHERLEPRMMMTINPNGTEFLVNETSIGFQSVNGGVSSVAVSDTLGTIAAYSGEGGSTRDGIFLRTFNQDGVEQGSAVLASSTIRGTRTNASVAANDAGDAVVVWQGRGLGDKYGIYLQRFDATGSALGDEQLVNQTVGGEQNEPSVAMAADGSFVIAWSGPSIADSSGIFARRYNADGTAASDEELVNTTTANHQIEAAVAGNSSGDYVITWSSRNQDGDDWGVFGQLFNAAGERQGDEFAVNTTTAGSQRESSVAMQADGTFMAVWSSFGQDGDSWAVVGQRFNATGTAVGAEFVVNTTTAGHQRDAQVAGAGGNYLVTWQSGEPDGSGWEVKAQQFDDTGARVGDEQAVNSSPAGVNSGHQEHPAVALNAAGNAAIVWSGDGIVDRQGVFGRSFLDDGAQTEDNLTPDLATITEVDLTAIPGEEFTLTVTATDPNAGDTLTYQLDLDNSPAGATIERTDNNTAIIRWTPSTDDQSTVVNFRVLVTDDGVPPLSDVEEFQVSVTNGSVLIDLSGSDESGADETANFVIGGESVSIVDSDLVIRSATDDIIDRATATFAPRMINFDEELTVDTTGTNIVATYTASLGRLLLAGEDSTENYEQVLRTLRYSNTQTSPPETRTVQVQVNDSGGRLSNVANVTINIGTADLVGFAQALEAAFNEPAAVQNNAGFYGAAWCPFCTDQKEVFEDGGQFLPFIEVTDANRNLNAIGTANNIEFFPTWIFPDGTRTQNGEVLSLQEISEMSGVPIPISDTPFIAPVSDNTLLVGSPLHVPLDGYDPNGGPLTYTVTTDRPGDVNANILENLAGNTNRSVLVNVAGYGDMVFELFEDRATRATNQFIELVENDFYDDVVFHRVIDGFVIQAGLRTATQVKDSGLDDFDDQFDFQLQHNRSGLLSYAKSNEDTNGAQFFVTDEPSALTRNLDFHHTIFGVLVEGESNRNAINSVSTGTNDTPIFNITTENAEVFTDTENAVLLLEANDGVTGDVTVTVTATDQQGNTFDRVFTMAIENDTFNGTPFFNNEDIVAPITLTSGATAQIQLAAAAADVEGDTIFYGAETPTDNEVPYTFTVDQAGVVNITLTDANATGTLRINVMAAASTNDFAINPAEGSLARSRRDGRVDLQLITIEVT